MKLGKVAVKLSANKRKLVTVKPSRRTLRKLLAALRKHRRVTVTLSGRATGAPGAASTRLAFRLRR